MIEAMFNIFKHILKNTLIEATQFSPISINGQTILALIMNFLMAFGPYHPLETKLMKLRYKQYTCQTHIYAIFKYFWTIGGISHFQIMEHEDICFSILEFQ
jgi:hypothetical protein